MHIVTESTQYSGQILMKLEFSENFFKNTQISNFMKIHSVGAKLFHADKWTDMLKLIVVFHNFMNMPKN